jgi:hypothetical protein
MKIKPFDPDPSSHYYKIQNAICDLIMPTCTPSEFMILNFIFRQTMGYNRSEDRLSYKQISEGTGIKGKATISKSLDGLEEKDYITRRGVERGAIWYGVNQALELNIETGSEIEPDDERIGSEIEPEQQVGDCQLVQKLNQGGSEIEPVSPHLVQKLNPPKDSLKDSLKDSTTATPFQSPKFDIDIDLADCLTLYRNNIGNLSQLLIEEFEEIYSGLSPPPTETRYEWIKYAILEAVGSKANNWKYVKAILENVNQAGSLARHKEKRNGSTDVSQGEREINGAPSSGRYRQRQTTSQAAGDTDATGRDAATNAKLYGLFGR